MSANRCLTTVDRYTSNIVAGDQSVALGVGQPLHRDRLDQPVPLNRMRQLTQRILIDVLTWLVGIELNLHEPQPEKTWRVLGRNTTEAATKPLLHRD